MQVSLSLTRILAAESTPLKNKVFGVNSSELNFMKLTIGFDIKPNK